MKDDGFNLNAKQGASVIKSRASRPVAGDEISGLRGHFKVEHLRMNPLTGEREVIGEYDFPNGIVNEGKNFMLNTMFNGATAHTSWYLGLIDGAGETLAATDTYDGIDAANGWAEFQDYTDAANSDSAVTRPAWNPPDSTAQQVINSSVIIFDMTGSGTVHGVFVAGGPNSQTKGDSTAATNTLWSTAPFSGGEVAVVNLDQLKITYFVNI